MLTAPLRVPAAVGEKVTLMPQAPPGAIAVPQVLVAAKSPLALIPAMANIALPVLLRVTVCAPDTLPGGWLANVKLVLETETAPLWISAEIALELELATARSNRPSPLKSPTARPPGDAFAGWSEWACSVPSPLPKRVEMLLPIWLLTETSSLPSPLKSPATNETGDCPVE